MYYIVVSGVSRKGEVCKLELSTANSECGLAEAPTGFIGLDTEYSPGTSYLYNSSLRTLVC